MKRRQIIRGVAIDRDSQVHVDSQLNELLFDIALALQADDNQPVDVQHVVAALVMAARSGEIESSQDLATIFATQRDVLAKYVGVVFQQFGGRVSEDD